MADMQLPTVIETGNNGFNNGFGGYGTGAGFIGGLILGSIWNGNGFGGLGGNGNAAAMMAASQDRTQLANAIEHVSDQVTQGNLSQLQSAQATQNAIHDSAMANMQSQNASTMAVMQGLNQNAMGQLQSTANLSQQLCHCCNNMSQQLDATGDGITAALTDSRIQSMQNTQAVMGGMANLGQAITNQGYENRLQTQALAAQLSQQHADLSRQIYEENCKDRELQREIASQAVRDQLVQSQAQNAALTAQINLTNQLSAQTQYLISQLKTTTTAA